MDAPKREPTPLEIAEAQITALKIKVSTLEADVRLRDQQIEALQRRAAPITPRSAVHPSAFMRPFRG